MTQVGRPPSAVPPEQSSAERTEPEDHGEVQISSAAPLFLYGRKVFSIQAKWSKSAPSSEWVGLFDEWRKKSAFDRDRSQLPLRHALRRDQTEEIQFGHFKGRRKWEKPAPGAHPAERDALLNMIVYQGDTEFASVEQHATLFETGPNRLGTVAPITV